MDYRELARGYRLTITEDEQTGTRVFIDDPGFGDTLPSIGDSFSDQYEELTLKTIDISKFGEQEAVQKYTCNYDTEVQENEDTPFEDLPRNLSVSAKFLKLEDKGKRDQGAGKNDRPLTKRITTVTLTIPKVYTTMASLLNKTKGVQNRVNDGPFEGQQPGMWAFQGCQASEYRNDQGFKRWKANFSFEMQSVTGAAGNWVVADQQDGWNFFWNQTQAAWLKTDPLVFEAADFGLLF